MKIENKQQYEAVVEFCNGLADQAGDDESHPLASLFDQVMTVIAEYEKDKEI